MSWFGNRSERDSLAKAGVWGGVPFKEQKGDLHGWRRVNWAQGGGGLLELVEVDRGWVKLKSLGFILCALGVHLEGRMFSAIE